MTKEELMQYSRYDAALDNAVVSVEPKLTSAYLVTVGNRAIHTLPDNITNQFGFKFTPVEAWYVYLSGNAPKIEKCLLIAPVGLNEFLIRMKYSNEFMRVHAEVITCDYKTDAPSWHIPAFSLPYVYSYLPKGYDNSVSLDNISSYIGNFDAYTFGQKYGELFSVGMRTVSLKEAGDIDSTTGFTLSDLPNTCNICSFHRLVSLYSYLCSSSSWYIMQMQEVNERLSIYLECLGDTLLQMQVPVKLYDTAKYRVLSMGTGSNGDLCLMILTLKMTKSGLEVKILKRDLASELAKGSKTSLSDIVHFKDSIKVTYIDKTVYYDRSAISEMLGCGITKDSEKQALATQLSGAGTDLELWGDGTLKKIMPSVNGVIMLPSAVRVLADNCIMIASQIKISKIVFNSGITKVSPKFLFVDAGSVNRNVASDCEIEYLGNNMDICISILQNYAQSAAIYESKTYGLNVKLYDDLDGRNIFVFSAYLCTAIPSYSNAAGLPKRAIEMGVSRYLSERGVKEVLNTVLCHLQDLCVKAKKARYASDNKCANPDNWLSLYNFNLSAADSRILELVQKLSKVFVDNFKSILSEADYSAYYNRIKKLWEFLDSRVVDLANHCMECYKKKERHNAVLSNIRLYVIRHSAFKE